MSEHKITHHTFSIKEAIGAAWEIATKNWWFFVKLLVLAQAIGIFLSFLMEVFLESEEITVIILGVLFMLVSWIVDIAFTFGKNVIYFKFVDNKKAAIEDLFSYFNPTLIWRSFAIYALLTLGTLIGLLLFIFPGIYFITKYWFAPYIFVDKRKGVLESFIASSKLTEGIKVKLFLLGILQGLIVLAGALALLVGLFVAVPMNTLSDLYVYRKLSAKK